MVPLVRNFPLSYEQQVQRDWTQASSDVAKCLSKNNIRHSYRSLPYSIPRSSSCDPGLWI